MIGAGSLNGYRHESPPGSLLRKKVGTAIHGQGKLSANLFDEIAFTFFFQSFQLMNAYV